MIRVEVFLSLSLSQKEIIRVEICAAHKQTNDLG
jgi:hypothetical protein